MALSPVKPELVSGTRDLLPAEALLQRKLVATIQRVYESFGFVPLETPCLERWGVLTGNDPNFNKSIFRAKVVRGAEDRKKDASELASDDSTLRFDLTVPLARVFAAYNDLPRPFKRYQIGRVFRGESAGAARYREFTQFDFDIVGSSSILSDVEVVQVMYETIRALGDPDFTIRFNTRRILNGLAEMVGCVNKAKELFRIIDKMDKLGIDGVLQEIQRQPDNEFDETALALTNVQTETVRRFLGLRGTDTTETITNLSSLLSNTTSVSALAGLEEL